MLRIFQGDLGAEGAVGPVGLSGKAVSISDHFVRLYPQVLHTLGFVTMQSETTNPFVYLGYSLSQTVSDVVILQSDIHLCVIWRMTVRFPFISIKKQR